ncbi:MAG: hypothetical protein J6Y19_08715 [Kiritimatiellae bacterium]|nr:hypothetical protein [Kiritimatiellia bacterium]
MTGSRIPRGGGVQQGAVAPFKDDDNGKVGGTEVAEIAGKAILEDQGV